MHASSALLPGCTLNRLHSLTLSYRLAASAQYAQNGGLNYVIELNGKYMFANTFDEFVLKT